MLKYLYVQEIFREVPGEITLGISISGCQIRCKGCHSRELWKDEGTPLTLEALDKLLKEHQGVTCVCLFGGESDVDYLEGLFKHLHGQVKTAWYCGLDMIPRDKRSILQYLDYYKTGHYNSEYGGLDSPTTNQRFYSLEHQGDGTYYEHDVTYKFWKK